MAGLVAAAPVPKASPGPKSSANFVLGTAVVEDGPRGAVVPPVEEKKEEKK